MEDGIVTINKHSFMKLKIQHTKSILILILLVLVTKDLAFSQASDKNPAPRPKFFIGIGAGPSINQIIYEGIPSLSGLISPEMNSYSGVFEIGYYFSRSFGLSTGLEYSSYNTELSLSSYENKFNTTDSENEPYERRVTGKGIKELQNISFLKMPVCLNLQFLIGRRFGIYIHGGVNIVIPSVKDYSSTGTFSYTGYYPAYNVTFQNLPAYGFPSNAAVSSKGQLELKSSNYEGLAGAGVQCFVSKKIQIVIGASYSRSLSTIAEYKSPENFLLSSDNNLINSMMGGSTNITTQSVGVSLALRYYLK
jgi:hypothetical protein